jgi:hypothetical protein
MIYGESTANLFYKWINLKHGAEIIKNDSGISIDIVNVC